MQAAARKTPYLIRYYKIATSLSSEEPATDIASSRIIFQTSLFLVRAINSGWPKTCLQSSFKSAAFLSTL